MTPAARVQAAIDILDTVLENGFHSELALKAWGHDNRYAGSKDRAAIQDHVYDALRNLRTFAAWGGSMTGRAILISALREASIEPTTIFTGQRFAPLPLTQGENIKRNRLSSKESFNLPNWLCPIWKKDLDYKAEDVALALTSRAPVFLRVNSQKTSRAQAINKLRDEGIICDAHRGVPSALVVKTGQRGIKHSKSYLEGFVELQDASSQLSVCRLHKTISGPFLDYCAGAGGKTLALANHFRECIYAHDGIPKRLRPLEARARRAGAKVMLLNGNSLKCGHYGLVFADVPCSGSGTWRRDPTGKWRLQPDELKDLITLQYSILTKAKRFLRSGGLLVYATCSVLRRENTDQIKKFLTEYPQWRVLHENQIYPSDNGDGFYFCYLQKPYISLNLDTG